MATSKWKGFVHAVIPGHGGVNENGKYQILKEGSKQAKMPDGTMIYEGEINRYIRDEVLTQAVPLGVKTVNLVPEIADIRLSERVNRINQKYDMWLERGYKLLVWELHNNAFNGKVYGSEIYTTRKDNFSDVMAETWVAQKGLLVPDYKLRKDYEDGDYVKEKDFYVIKNSKAYAVLIEFFFFDNPDDIKRFNNTDGYHLWAKTVVESMKEIDEKYFPNEI
jgi:N-acetylmuramoyl-L-alanine amidase